jgi:hypothetical protein
MQFLRFGSVDSFGVTHIRDEAMPAQISKSFQFMTRARKNLQLQKYQANSMIHLDIKPIIDLWQVSSKSS